MPVNEEKGRETEPTSVSNSPGAADAKLASSMKDEDDDHLSIAVVSGKGGAGKTIVAVSMMMAFDDNQTSTVLVDGDPGTGGLTYYLNQKHLNSAGIGLCNYVMEDNLEVSRFSPFVLEEIHLANLARCVPIGDHRTLLRSAPDFFSKNVGSVLEGISREAQVTIVDCRGGIDDDSLAVCRSVDEIIIVVETDQASILATRFLVDVLGDHAMNHKIKGFIINKNFDDPTLLENTLKSFYGGAQHLGSTPFDLHSYKRFILGELPSRESPLFINLFAAIHKAFPRFTTKPRYRPWIGGDYQRLSGKDSRLMYGGAFLLMVQVLLIYFIVYILIEEAALVDYYSRQELLIIAGISLLVGLVAVMDRAKRALGKIVGSFAKLSTRIVQKLLSE